MWPCVCLIAVSDATVRDTWKVACTQQGTLHYPGRLENSQHQCVPLLVALLSANAQPVVSLLTKQAHQRTQLSCGPCRQPNWQL